MPIHNTETHYGSVSKWFHWIVALLIIGMLALGTSFDFISDKPTRLVLIQFHKTIGVTILFLMILRYLWRFMNPRPALPHTIPCWQRFASHVSHHLLYLTTFAMTLSGWIMSTAAGYSVNFWWIANITFPGIPKSEYLDELMGDIHLILAWVVFGLLIIHVLAAIKHHVIHKDDTLRRMMPSRG